MTKFIRILNILFLAALFSIAFSFGIALYEDTHVNRLFEEFIARANPTPVKEWEHGGVTHLYFEVPRETSRGEGNRPVFSDAEKRRPGVRGDILLTQEFPFPSVRWADIFVSYYFGGHAALVTGPNNVIEATGTTATFSELVRSIFHRGYDTEAQFSRNLIKSSNNWLTMRRQAGDPNFDYFNGFYRNNFVAVRIKDDGYFDENIEIAIDYAESAFDRRPLYNFLFWLNTRYRYYCTDIISRAFDRINHYTERNINLNRDGFITSVNDIVLSPDVYITILMRTVGDKRHIYFLADPS